MLVKPWSRGWENRWWRSFPVIVQSLLSGMHSGRRCLNNGWSTSTKSWRKKIITRLVRGSGAICERLYCVPHRKGLPSATHKRRPPPKCRSIPLPISNYTPPSVSNAHPPLINYPKHCSWIHLRQFRTVPGLTSVHCDHTAVDVLCPARCQKAPRYRSLQCNDIIL